MGKALRRRIVEKGHGGVRIEGFCRLQIRDYDDDGLPSIVAADSGWQGPNQVTNIGFQNYINYVLGGSVGSILVSYAAVGTGTTPASNAGSLPGEYAPATNAEARRPTTYSAPSSTQIQWVASWASSDNTSGGNIAVANAGLYNHSSNLSLMCGKTYTSSTWGTNQALNLTYSLNLSFT
jgi:hypothetical protein